MDKKEEDKKRHDSHEEIENKLLNPVNREAL